MFKLLLSHGLILRHLADISIKIRHFVHEFIPGKPRGLCRSICLSSARFLHEIVVELTIGTVHLGRVERPGRV